MDTTISTRGTPLPADPGRDEGSAMPLEAVTSSMLDASRELTQRLASITVPTAEELRGLATSELADIVTANEAHLLASVAARRNDVEQLGFSGRGQVDLARIMQDRTGSYPEAGGGMLMAFAVREISPSFAVALRELKQCASDAVDYATLENPTRLNLDPVPGGVMIFQLDQWDRNIGERGRTRIGDKAVAEDENPRNLRGETRFTLSPENWDRVYRGTIPAEQFLAFKQALDELRGEFRRILGSTTPENPTPEQLDFYNNRFYPRVNLLTEYCAQFVLARALECI